MVYSILLGARRASEGACQAREGASAGSVSPYTILAFKGSLIPLTPIFFVLQVRGASVKNGGKPGNEANSKVHCNTAKR